MTGKLAKSRMSPENNGATTDAVIKKLASTIADSDNSAYRPAHHSLHGEPDRLVLARSRAMRFEMRPPKADKLIQRVAERGRESVRRAHCVWRVNCCIRRRGDVVFQRGDHCCQPHPFRAATEAPSKQIANRNIGDRKFPFPSCRQRLENIQRCLMVVAIQWG